MTSARLGDGRSYRRIGDTRDADPAMAADSGRSVTAPRRLRVLVFTTVFPNPAQPLHGVFVAERLKRLARSVDVRVVAPVARLPWRLDSVPRRVMLDGLEVRHPTFVYVRGILKWLDGFFLFLSSLNAVNDVKRTFDFDLIDAHFAYPDGLAALLLGWLFHRPVTVTERGTLATFRRGSLRRRLAEWTLRRVDRVIAVAPPLADLAVSAGASAERVIVIENGVDTERFALRERAAARKRLGVSPSARLLLSVGHLAKRKGFQRVISVMPKLVAEVPELQLAIVGGPGAEGNIHAQLASMVRDLGLEGRVVLVGAQPPDAVAEWLNAADVFILASDHEGSPNVIWEALASGRPVVTSRVGDVVRMVPEFAGIVYDDPHDVNQLASCLADALSRQWDEDRIRAHGQAHGWDGVARRVLAQWTAALGPEFEARLAGGGSAD